MLNIVRKIRYWYRLIPYVKFSDWLKIVLNSPHKLPKNNLELLPFRFKSLSNRYFFIRRNSIIDHQGLLSVFVKQYQLPPKALPPNPVILDLGVNIGMTIVFYKNLYPDALIIGYEMDKVNFDIAQRNLEGFENVQLHQKAIWYFSDSVNYDASANVDAYSIQPIASSTTVTVQSICIEDIIKIEKLKIIDFIKMDIEGAEEQVLTSPNASLWMARTRQMNIEIHKPSFLPQAQAILEANGFEVWKDTNHWSALMAVKLIL